MRKYMFNKKILVNEPYISERAKQYVRNSLDQGWISSGGPFVDAFEESFAKYLGVKYATSVSNGTAALHLAFAALDLKPGDEVIIPDQTIISCALGPVYLGLTPVFVDVEKDTGNISASELKKHITKKTKAILVVHLFGHTTDMSPIMKIAKRYNLFVIEDCAQAHGSLYKGKKCGTFGDIATFSFYGNKIVTTGEGGMVTTNHKRYIDSVTSLKNLAHKKNRRFYHEQIGFNYRMGSLQAALGMANLEDIDTFIEKKRKMATAYKKLLSGNEHIILPVEKDYAFSTYWMYNIVVKPSKKYSRKKLVEFLRKKNIDTREYFFPLHAQPVLKKFVKTAQFFPNSKFLSKKGLYLPSGLNIQLSEVEAVCNQLNTFFK